MAIPRAATLWACTYLDEMQAMAQAAVDEALDRDLLKPCEEEPSKPRADHPCHRYEGHPAYGVVRCFAHDVDDVAVYKKDGDQSPIIIVAELDDDQLWKLVLT